MPYAQAGEIKLWYESLGEGTPFIIQSHHHRLYLSFQAPYFAQFYRVIVFDRRGTGRSDNPPGPWIAADLAADVAGLMDTLEIESAIVGGISLGGVVASQVGLDYPDRVKALIVGGTVPRLWPLGSDWLQQQMDAAAGRGRIIVNQPRSYEWEEEGPPTIAPTWGSSDFGRYMATIDTGMGNPDAVLNMLGVLKEWDQSSRYSELQQLDVPALVIVGGNEPQKTIELSCEWSQQFKRGEFVILPNTHHGAGLENPVGWNTAVHKFLSRNGL